MIRSRLSTILCRQGASSSRLLLMSNKNNHKHLQRKILPIGSIRHHGGPHVAEDAPTVTLTFIQPDESTKDVQARIGETLLQVAHRNDIDLEGACEGVCACSTCHLIFPQDTYDTLGEPSEDEEDMLDMAFGLTDTSRLGCQINVTQEMDGISLTMPKAT